MSPAHRLSLRENMMRADSFAGQLVAALSRRPSVVEDRPDRFPRQLVAALSRRTGADIDRLSHDRRPSNFGVFVGDLWRRRAADVRGLIVVLYYEGHEQVMLRAPAHPARVFLFTVRDHGNSFPRLDYAERGEAAYAVLRDPPRGGRLSLTTGQTVDLKWSDRAEIGNGLALGLIDSRISPPASDKRWASPSRSGRSWGTGGGLVDDASHPQPLDTDQESSRGPVEH